MSRSCLIVGTGMAGLAAGRRLTASGYEVTLVDKGRRPGGRMATRRLPGEGVADHGAQFFTVRHPLFADAVRQWVEAGVAVPWFCSGGHTRYRGASGMNGIARHLASGLDVRCGMRIDRIIPNEKRWVAVSDTGEQFRADTLLLTPPAPQALALCKGFATEAVRGALESIVFEPCLALLCEVDGASQIPPPGFLRPASGPVDWIADNCRKGISATTAVTIHAGARFSREQWAAPDDAVADALLRACGSDLLGGTVTAWQLHRWRYSQPVSAVPDAETEGCLYVSDTTAIAPYALAGDAWGGSRVEGAFLSGLAAAERILRNG